MARTIYSTRFFGVQLSTSGGLTATYTVPAGKRAILKSVQMASSTASWAARLRGLLTPGAVPVVLFNLQPQTANVQYMWAGSIVFNAGDVMEVTHTTAAGAGTVTAWASGYLLNE